MRRRVFLTKSLLTTLTGLFASTRTLWAETANKVWPGRPREAFRSEELDASIKALFGDQKITPSDKIKIVAAELAENGAVVPVKVETEFQQARQIALFASKNPIPLLAQFSFMPRIKPFVATRVKLAESSEIIAIVETENGLYQASRHVEVTIGGCGA